jgi:hypothetical protein
MLSGEDYLRPLLLQRREEIQRDIKCYEHVRIFEHLNSNIRSLSISSFNHP